MSRPHRAAAGSRRTSPSSITRSDGCGARPVIKTASNPVFLPAMANPLLAKESLIRSVNGLLLTTANLAEVVNGLPTSGLNTNAIDASADSGSARAACSRSKSWTPKPLPPRKRRRSSGVNGTAFSHAPRQIDAQVAAVVAEECLRVGGVCHWVHVLIGRERILNTESEIRKSE